MKDGHMHPSARPSLKIVRLLALTVAAGLATSGAAIAQEVPASRAYPGSFWISSGAIGPAEPDNYLTQAGLEQGFTVWERGSWFLVPFASVRVSADSQGYDWNNKHPSMVGVKLIRRVAGGVIQGGGGVMFERVDAAGDLRHPTAFVSYWAGWTADRQAHTGARGLSFPGNIDVSSGLLSGRDPHNWLTVISAQQGIAVYRSRVVSLVPYAGGMVGFDSKRRTWENRATYDLGVKLVRPLVGGVLEAGVAQRRQHQLTLDRAAESAPIAFVNLWIGWNPQTISAR
jgi:hypothetical protein